MKIGLYMDADYAKPGGVQEYVKGLYDFLAKTRHTPVVINPNKRHQPRDTKRRRIVSLGKSIDFTTLRSSASIALTWSEKQRLHEFFSQENLDILHLMAPFGVMGFQLLEMSPAKNVATFHVTNAAKLVGFSLKAVFTLLKKRMEKIDGRIAVSSVAFDFSKRFFPGDYELIPPGVDTERFNPQVPKIKDFLDDKINILFIGRLDQRKGIKYLLRAYKQIKPLYPNCRLIIGGTGPKEQEAERFARDKKLKDVVFTGYISPKHLPNYFSSGNIFCSPATKDETFGIVLIEAFSSGLPVVAFANDGYKTVLEDENMGFLVKNRNVGALAQALFVLLTNEKLRRSLGKKNRHLAEKKYSWNVVGRSILKFYSSL